MILAIDTATRWTALALHNGTAVLAEHGWYTKNNQTTDLGPAIADMFDKANITAADLTGIAVAIGPGSYTGLRIGLGVAKGLALSHNTPLFGVPTLDIVAAAVRHEPHQLIAVAEAGRSRICIATYRWARHSWQRTHDEPVAFNVSWEEVLENVDEPTLFAGEISAEAAKLIRRGGRHFTVANPANSVRRPSALAELGWLRHKQKRADSPTALAPIYLRQPDGT